MRLSPVLAPLSLVAALVVAPAQAYTPESGIWWNPNESGSGYVIEIQDNFMALGYYGGDAQGHATWWTSAGFLTGNALFDTKRLDRTSGSQCIGCPYTGFPQVLAGDGGTVTVRFDPNDNTKATLTWSNGRTVQIQRQQFYFKRPTDPATLPMQASLMLGEWQMMMDFSSNAGAGFAYYGDVLVFDRTVFNSARNRWEFEGCRADTSEVGRCSNAARANHLAYGYYEAGTGLHVIDVVDTPQNMVRYVIDTSTNSGQGEITVYPRNANPANYDAYPMRSFRTASRTFVQDGFGPAKAEGTAADASRGLSDRLLDAGLSLEPSAAPVSRFAPSSRDP
jgi:hypothetical protein